MSVSLESFGIDRLSVGDRLELIEQIWDSLPEELAPQDIPDWHLAELAKRRAAAESKPARASRSAKCLLGLKAGNEAAVQSCVRHVLTRPVQITILRPFNSPIRPDKEVRFLPPPRRVFAWKTVVGY